MSTPSPVPADATPPEDLQVTELTDTTAMLAWEAAEDLPEPGVSLGRAGRVAGGAALGGLGAMLFVPALRGGR